MSEKVGSIYYDLTLDTSGLIKGQRKAEQSLDGIGKEADKLDAKFTKVAASISAALASIAVGVLLDKLVQTQRQFDVMFASLKTMTGGLDQAGQAFERLRKFSETTPYTLEQSVNGFVKLKALGLDPSERAMTSFGNTASAMGKDLMQMIEAVADASTGEFERLKEFGIKAKKEGDNVALTFRGTTTTIANSADSITDYLVKIGETEFAGAMAERMNTLDGNISNLNDSLSALYLTISQAGIGEAVAAGVRKATEAISEMTTSVKEGGLTEYFDDLKPYITAAEVAAVSLAGAMAGQVLTALAAAAVEAYAAATAIGVATVATRTFSAVIATLGGPIGIAITGLALLAMNWDKVSSASMSAAQISEESARRIAGAQKKSGDRITNDLGNQLKDAEKGLSAVQTQLNDATKKSIYGGTVSPQKDIDDLNAKKDAYVKSINDVKSAIKGATTPWDIAPDSVMPDKPKKSGGNGGGKTTKTAKSRPTADQKFDDEKYLLSLNKKTVDGYALINASEAEALRNNEVLLEQHKIKQDTYEKAITTIKQVSAKERQDLRLQEEAENNEAQARSLKSMEQAAKDASDAARKKLEGRDASVMGTLQIKASMGGEADKENLIRAKAAEDAAQVDAFQQQYLSNSQIYADQKVAIEAKMVEDIRALHDATNSLRMAQAADVFDSLVSITKNAAGEQSGIYQAMFAAQKAFAIASAIVNIQTAMSSAAMSLPFPGNLAAMGIVAANTASIISTISGTSMQGRQYGGPVNANSMYRVNETGAPEMFTASNGSQYMMPTKSGSVTAADKIGGGNSAPTVIIQNMGNGVAVQSQSYDQQSNTLKLVIAEISNQFASNSGQVWSALRSGSNVTGRI